MPGLFIAMLAVATFALVATPTPSPAPSTAPSVSGTPVAAATPAYNFVYRPSPSPESTPFPGPNPPAISEIDLSDSTLVTPGTIRVRVLTSNAVTSVVADTFGNTIKIPQQQPGTFVLEGYVPAVPNSLKNRSYNVNFTAAAADGRSVSVVLPLTLK